MRTLPILSEADAVGRSRRHVSACQVHSRVALGHFRPAFDVPVPRVFIEFLSGMAIGLASTAKERWSRAEAPGEKFFTSVFQKCVIYVCVSRTHKRGVRVVPPRCSGTSAVETTSECTHPPCPWPHQYRRQRPHFVPSSTPFLARFGLVARATVRVEEDTGSVPRSPTGSQGPLSTHGLRSSDGRLVRTARSHILADFADTRPRISGDTIAEGRPVCFGVW